MKKTLLLLSLVYLPFLTFSQTKYALVVAIGDYPTVSGREKNWSDLSSMNDVALVRKFLRDQGFDKTNIDSLYNEKATSDNLTLALDKSISKLKEGDIFYFHFSGHGQQVADLPASKNPKTKLFRVDEQDGYDEALVLYNAPVVCDNTYEMTDHFIDDQVHFYTQKIREKIGTKGQVIVVLDACHSGTATRGAEELTVRGSKELCQPKNYQPKSMNQDNTLGFDADLDLSNNGKVANMIAFFGCKADQVNREIKDDKGVGYGSLTYFFTKAVYELKDQASYQNLFSRINEQMILKFRNEQHPVIEGDNLNTLVFNGGVAIQKPYFDLMKIQGDLVRVDGGYLRGLNVGDSIGIYSNTTMDPKGAKELYKGVITECLAYTSVVTLNSMHQAKDPYDHVKFRAFVSSSVNLSNQIKLKLNVQSREARKQLTDYFKNIPNVVLDDKDFSYQIVDTTINSVAHARIYIGNNQTNALRGMPFRPLNKTGILDSFNLYLSQSTRTDIFRKLDLNSKNTLVDASLYRCLSGCSDENPTYDTVQVVGNFSVQEGESFGLAIKNTGKTPIYINIVDIYPTNQVDWLDDQSGNGRLQNIVLQPGSQQIIKNTVSPPYGMEQFKIIATDRAIDLSQLEMEGSSLATRGGNEHPLLQFVDGSMKGTRGSSASSEIGATVKSILFEITK